MRKVKRLKDERAEAVLPIRKRKLRGRIDYLQSIRPLKTPDPTDYTSFLFIWLRLILPSFLGACRTVRNFCTETFCQSLKIPQLFVTSFADLHSVIPKLITFCLMEEFLYLLCREINFDNRISITYNCLT